MRKGVGMMRDMPLGINMTTTATSSSRWSAARSP